MNAYSDSALLDRWISSRDPISFREITLRHAGMVYSTCKRILGSPADAEDVAQDCFLALAQSRAGIQSLPGWLHTAAVRRSYNVVRGEKRRRAREQQYAAQPSQDECLGGGETADDATWETVQEHVDKAITELPDELRESIIAYFLEGRSQDEIARSCEVNQATVSRRIARGIELIRDSLGKHGVAVSLAALTAMLGARMAEAAPPALVSALGKLALTTARPFVAPVARAAGLLVRKGTLAVIGAIVAGIGGVSVIAYRHQSETSANATSKRTVSGQDVQQPHDLQIAGSQPERPAAAADALDTAPSSPQQEPVPILASTQGVCSVSGRVVDEAGKPVAEARLFARSTPMSCAAGDTDKDGRFLIQGMESTDKFCMIACTRPPRGKGCVATKIFGPAMLTPAGLTDLELVAYATGTITGSLVDQDGQPVPEAQVLFMPPTFDTQYDCIFVDMEPSGRFKATGVPCEELGVYVRIAGASIPKDSWLERVTLAPRQQLSGLNLVYTGGGASHLTGKVVDETGAPVSGARIFNFVDRDETCSNADGAFALLTAKDSLSDIVVRHPDYEDTRLSLHDSTNVEIVLHKAGQLHGKVVSAETRQPVQSYQVLFAFAPLVQSDFIHWDKAISVDDAEGKFDQPCSIRGAVTVLVRAGGFADTKMPVSEAERQHELTIALPAAQTLKGFVVNPAGQPVQEARVFADLLPGSSYKTYEKPDARSGPDGSFTLERLAAGEHFVLADHLEYGPAQQTITVPQTEPVTLALTKGCVLSGACSGLERSARFAIGVRLDRLHYQEIERENGAYEIAGLPAGNATVTCRLFEHHGGWADTWQLEKTAVLEEGKTTAVDFDWAGADAIVEGTASFATGPAQEFRVSAHVVGLDGTELTVHISGRPDGTFSIPRLYPGRVTLTATRFDQRRPTEEISSTVDAVAEATVNCNLLPQNPHVRIHLARGAPLVHACEAAERPV